MASPTVEHARHGRPSRPATDDDAATGVEPIGEPPSPPPPAPSDVLGAPPPTDRLRGWVVTAVLGLVAAAVRFTNLGTPTDGGTPVFDEKHYVPQAWQMLRNGGVEDNPGFELVVHPPLGKQLIALGESAFGYDAVGWRASAALASVLCVVLIVRVGRRLTRSTLLGGIAGVLLICDGLSHVQGRMGMLDVFSALFVVAGFTTLVRDRDDVRARMARVVAEARVLDSPLGPRMGVRWWRLATGVLLGLGCAVKWSGIYWVMAFAVLSVVWDLTSRRTAGVARPWAGTFVRDVLPSVWALALVPVAVYFADWSFWFASETATDRYVGSNALSSMLYFEGKVLAFHQGLTTQSAGAHPWESKPWSWPMGLRPMLYYYAGDGVTGCGDAQCVSAVMLIGTPALWWPSLPVLGFSLWRVVTRADWRYGAVLVGYGAGIVPWFMDIDRQMFFFYMTPVVPFLVLVTLGMVKDVKVEGDAVSLQIELTTPACPLRDTIGKDVEAALRAVGAARVNLSWGAQVRSAPGAVEGGLTPGVKNIVLVGAGKGGVGKSTVALNLAVALSRLGARVGILDADIYGPSMPLMTGATARPVSKDGKRLEPLVAHGLKIMSIGFLIDPDQALIWRGPMVTSALVQLLRDVSWGDLDYLVLDLPPGTGDVPLTLAQNIRAAGVVLVSTPQDVALADVIRAKLMFDKVSIPVLGIVENMSSFVCPHCRKETNIFDHGGVRTAADKMGIRFLGEIPLDLAVREGGDKGVPVVAGDPDGPQAQAFLAAARQVAGAVSVQNMKAPKLPVIGAQPRA